MGSVGELGTGGPWGIGGGGVPPWGSCLIGIFEPAPAGSGMPNPG
jgi:hypothetical protein